MQIQTNCEVCGKGFSAIKTTQKYCSRKHFKRAYYIRKREEFKKDEANPKFPSYSCDLCGTKTELIFDPVKFHLLFDNYQCPNCNVRRCDLWKHGVLFVFTYSRAEVHAEFGAIKTTRVVISTRGNP